MTDQQRPGLRWVVPVLAGVVLAAVAVIYALIQITTPAVDQAGPGGTVARSTGTGSDLVSATTELTGAAPLTDHTEADPSALSPDQTGSAGSATSSPMTDEPSTSAPVPPTTLVTLPGSGVTLPASWSGSATVTIAVMGECATETPSVYTDLPADIAVDLVQNLANKAEVGLPPDVDGDEPILTIGVNGGGVPSLVLYTAQIDDAGGFHRFWDMNFARADGRTTIDATLVDTSFKGTNPNVLVDAETSLRSCEPAGTVMLPRALAPGSTLTGFITPTRARFTLHATTTDDRREVTITVDAHRS